MAPAPFRLQDIIAAVSPAWLAQTFYGRKYRVLTKILACGTGDLGYVLVQCDECGKLDWVARGCRDRNCPSCAPTASIEWVEKREAELLPVPYFHIVFAPPHELIPLTLENPALIYDLIMKASKETLLKFARTQETGGYIPAIIQVLHTCNQRMDPHPHVHNVISGGGLRVETREKAPVPQDGDQADIPGPWVPCANDQFLFPVAALSKVFKAKMLAGLRELRAQGRLTFRAPKNAQLVNPKNWTDLLDKLYDLYWNVYAKRPFGGPRQVLRYLARYTHRTAISNRRILSLKDGKVTFSWKDRKAHVTRERTMTVESFLQLFSMHILPKGFHRIRLAGLIAPNARKKLEEARKAALEAGAWGTDTHDDEPTLQPEKRPQSLCPHCKKGTRHVILTLLSLRITWGDLSDIHKLGGVPPPRYEILPVRNAA